MGTVYILDDTFQISEEIQNMSEEEMKKQAKILEEEGRRERKKIKKRKTLLDEAVKNLVSMDFRLS